MGSMLRSESMIPKQLFWMLCVLAGAVSGCAPHSTGSSVSGGLSGAAGLVSANALNRAANGACWGECSGGKVCDKESGLCVAATCDPPCRQDQMCERLSMGFTCVPRSTPNSPSQTPIPKADGESGLTQ